MTEMKRFSIIVIVGALGAGAFGGSYGGGTGTAEDPFQIWDANDLNEVGLHEEDWDKCFVLMDDVDLAEYTYSRALIAPDTNDVMSRFQGVKFTGVFDGAGHKVANLFCDGRGGKEYIGLFGYVGVDGDIRNLDLAGVSLIGSGREVPVGGYFGALAGTSRGRISNCSAAVSIECEGGRFVGGLVGEKTGDGTIVDCHSTGDVTGEDHVGGLTGHIEGSILNCYSSCTVDGDSSGVGGLVGTTSRCMIMNCYATGSVSIAKTYAGHGTGGLVGKLSGDVINCYSTGSVTGGDEVGVLVGRNFGVVCNCYATGAVSGSGRGLIGGNMSSSRVHNSFWDVESSGRWGSSNARATGLTTAEMQSIDTFLDAGWDFLNESANGTNETWRFGGDGGYPILSTFVMDVPFPLEGDGKESNPYLIGSPEELGMVSWYNRGASFRLANDIDLSGIHWSGAIVPFFDGVFEGDGNTLVNLQISGHNYTGLFGRLESSSIITNLHFKGGLVSSTDVYAGSLAGSNGGGRISNCSSTVSVSGDGCAGGLVGKNDSGEISDCSWSGSVSGDQYVGGVVGFSEMGSIFNCDVTGDVEGAGRDVGGVVGRCDGSSLSKCHTNGSVYGSRDGVGGIVGNLMGAISDCYSECSVQGDGTIGGLAGRADGSIAGCYATGNVSGWGRDVGGLIGYNMASVSKSYATGDVYCSDIAVGGLVGWNQVGVVTECFARGSVEGREYVGGLMGVNKKGSVADCYSTGFVYGRGEDVGGLAGVNSEGSITNSYSTGFVHGVTDTTGGLVGGDSEGSVSQSFWDVDTSEYSTSAGGTGLSLDVMKRQSSFVNWDFVGETTNGTEDIWKICEGTNYPRLAWEVTTGDFECPDGVGVEDIAVFAASWLSTGAGENWDERCNLVDTGSEVIDGFDWSVFASYWGSGFYIWPDMSLLGFWNFDTSSGYTARDSSPRGIRNGVLINMDQSAWVEGNVGNALQFDGVDDYVQIIDFKGVAGLKSRTCGAWIRTTDVEGQIVSWGSDGVLGGRWVFATQSEGYLRLEVGAGFIEGSTQVCDGQWHHVVCVLDSDVSLNVSEVKLYVDGVVDMPSVVVGEEIDTIPGQDVMIGLWQSGPSYFRGCIDEVRLYDRPLSDEEIAALAL